MHGPGSGLRDRDRQLQHHLCPGADHFCVYGRRRADQERAGRIHQVVYTVGCTGACVVPDYAARVYRAVNTVDDRVVAIKVLRMRYSGDLRVTEQFLREARLQMPLLHPNIVDSKSEIPTYDLYIFFFESISIDLELRACEIKDGSIYKLSLLV